MNPEHDNQDHPDDAAIRQYLADPEAPAQAPMRRHLATCSNCRREVSAAMLLRQQAPWLEVTGDADHSRLADLLAGRLDTAAAAALRDEIRQDPQRLRSALHFASHATAMARLTPPPAAGQSPARRLRGWLGARLRIELPLWQLAPLAAVLVIAITLLPRLGIEQPAPRVIAFADPPTLRYLGGESLPGIGFFSTRGNDALAFDGVEIEWLDERKLRLRWPEIDGANGYNLRLKVFRDGQSERLADLRTTRNEALIQLDRPLTQHRYEWDLSGETAARGAFTATGGFVIERSNNLP